MPGPDPRKAEEARRRAEALRRQVRHPYITGQELKPAETPPAAKPPPQPPPA